MPNRDDRDDPEESEAPLVGDGGSADELGWEAPTRPDRPLVPRRNADGAGGRPHTTNGVPQTDDFERERSRVERDRARHETD